jgi:uncharacterized protein YjiS (DUF1127 family)
MTVSQLFVARRRSDWTRQGQGLAALGDATHWAAAAVREWRRRSRERAELATLDDHSLRDIGITRADADYLSSKPFWRE